MVWLIRVLTVAALSVLVWWFLYGVWRAIAS